MFDPIYAAILASFGARVRLLREDIGISQEALAHKAGTHRTYIGCVERGEKNISLINIARLAAALNQPLSSLCCLDDDATKCLLEDDLL